MIEDQVVSAFEIDLNGWRLRDYRNYRRAMRVEDFETVWEELEKVIIRWPYSTVPNFETLDSLSFTQFADLTRALNKAMGDAFAEGN